jgi:hypothetical protein
MCVSARVVGRHHDSHSMQLHELIMPGHRQGVQCIAGMYARLHVHLQVSSMRASAVAMIFAQLVPPPVEGVPTTVVARFCFFHCDHGHHMPCHLCQICS